MDEIVLAHRLQEEIWLDDVWFCVYYTLYAE